MIARCLVGLLLFSSVAAAAPDADRWLDGLYDQVAADLRAGKPLVVEVHVALCDNTIIACGNPRLGDGDNLETNLYWATTGGLRGWFTRRGSGWTRVARHPGSRKAILEELVFKRRVEPSAAFRARGVEKSFAVYVVASAWRGTKIDGALETYVAEVFGHEPRAVEADEGVTLNAGAGAHIVAYVGHNRFMDREPFDFAAAAKKGGPGGAVKGTIAVACASASYLAHEVSSERRVPLLMTADLLFAGSMSFEGAVRAFAGGGSYAELRVAAARAYAEEEDKPVARVQSLFTNPSDRRWRR